MTYPKLHIMYAYPYDRRQRDLYAARNFGKYPEPSEVKKRVQELQDWWNEINKDDRVFKRIEKHTGIVFPYDLEFYIYGSGPHTTSAPLMMPVMHQGEMHSEDYCAETIIHELSHRIATCSDKYPGLDNYWDKLQEEYKEETKLTQNHIIVFAILVVVLKELVDEETYNRMLKPPHPEYMRALNLVNEKGAEVILKEIKEATS